MKFPKAHLQGKRKRRPGIVGDPTNDYLKHNKTTNRQRIDPLVAISTVLENILNEIRETPGVDVQPFLFPVNHKVSPGYPEV